MLSPLPLSGFTEEPLGPAGSHPHSQHGLTCLPLSSGSMYDGLADNYNNYGTTSRNSYYSKFQAGNGSWGYPVRHHFHSKSWGALGHCRGGW